MGYKQDQAHAGFMPIQNGIGNSSPKISYYTVGNTYATAIGEGCFLMKGTNGLQITLGATGIALGAGVGVAAMNMPAYVSGATRVTGDIIAVYDDPNQLYAIRCATHVTAANKTAFRGRFAALSASTNTYSTTYRQSNATLAVTGAATTASTTKCFQIVDWLDQSGEPSWTASTSSASSNTGKPIAIVKLCPRYSIYHTHSVTHV